MHYESTHTPNVEFISLPSTLQHKILPEPHAFHVVDEPIEAEPAGELVTSMDLMLAFPFVVHVSKVQDLTMDNNSGNIGICIHIGRK